MASGSATPRQFSPAWRMRLLVGAIVTAIAGAAMAGWLIARTSTPPTGPVILVSIDSLRADHLGAYGYRRSPTPAIDALAADGVVFDRAYAHSPLTVPAHLAILSGRLPFETGVRDDEAAVLPPRLPMLSSVLHRRGFKTAGIVSSALLGRGTGLAAAFDFYDDDVPARSPSVPAARASRAGRETLEVAKRWMDQQSNRFVLFLHLDEPRAPYEPPPQTASGTPYDGEVRAADATLGELVRFLKSRDLYERAIIVLVADHGEALGEHGEAEHGVFLHESTLHVPLVVKLAKNEGAGRRRAELVQQIDILPTVLDLMGAPRPSGLRGRSLRHLLTSDEATLPPAQVYAESLLPRIRYGWSDLVSVTDGRFRYVRAPKPELYDLQQDRAERENLAETNPAKAAQMAALVEKFTASAPASPSLLTEDDFRLLGVGAPPGVTSAAPAAAPATPQSPAVSTGQNARPTETATATPAAPAAPEVDPKDRVQELAQLREAEELASRFDLTGAAAAYRQITAADRGNVDAWVRLGDVLLSLNSPKDSLEAFRTAVRLRPENAPAILGAARSLARLGKGDEADAWAAVAAKLSPLEAGETRVRLELRRKNYERARLAAEAARSADSETPMPAFAEGVELYQAGKYDEALPKLEEAVRLAATRPVQVPDVRLYAADTLAQLRRYTEAESLLNDELKWFPDNLRARESLGDVYEATGRSAEVASLAAALVRQVPTPDAYAAAARLSSDKKSAAAFRNEARQRFGDAAVRAAEAAGTR
jgi:arylsulfatase A-like enzyme